MNFNPKTERNDREFGTSIHEMVSTFYKYQNLPPDQRKLKSVKAFLDSWDPAHDLPKKNTNIGLVVSDKYCECYKRDNSTYLMDMVETENVIAMPNNTTLYMRIDRILIDKGFYTVVDTKTTGRKQTEYYWKAFDLNFQMSAYHYTVENLVGHCDNIQIDSIHVDPNPSFERRSFQRTETQIQEWLNTYIQLTGAIRASFCSNQQTEIENFYQNTCSCDKFGGCPYASVCRFGMSHPDVQIMFNTKEIGDEV
jgi:hypothetical protein